MLVLNRKQEQTIEIDGGITIKVLKTSSGEVKLGFSAPAETRIQRGETVKPPLDAKLQRLLAEANG